MPEAAIKLCYLAAIISGEKSVPILAPPQASRAAVCSPDKRLQPSSFPSPAAGHFDAHALRREGASATPTRRREADMVAVNPRDGALMVW